MSDSTIKYPSNIFIENEPVLLHYSLSDKETEWRVLDWKSEEVSRGMWDTASGPLDLSNLPLGYYEIETKEKGGLSWQKKIPFARVVDPSSRTDRKNPYGMVTAQSVISYVSNEMLADLALLSGATMIRDQIRWDGLATTPMGDYHWGKYEQSANFLKERNLDIVSVLFRAPEKYKGHLNDLPHDLLALHNFSQSASEKFTDSILAFEYETEQDVPHFNMDSAWDYAAALKASYLGIKAGNPLADVLIGSETSNLDLRFNELVFYNGGSHYFDIFNFHTYTPLQEYSKVVKGKVDLLERWGADHKPMWLTEFGPTLDMFAKGEPIVGNRIEHDKEQELIQAEFISKGNITAQSLGVAQTHFFILPPWNSDQDPTVDGLVYGLLRHDLTVKPAFVAQSNLVAQLGAAEYLGKVNLGRSTEGYLYGQPDGKKTLVFWGGNTISLGDQNSELELVDMMGKKTMIDAQNGNVELFSDKYPQYLHGVQTLDVIPTRIAKDRLDHVEDQVDKSIVLRVDLSDSIKIINRVAIELTSGYEAEVVLDIFNFSNEEKRVELNNLSSNCTINGLPAYVTVPAMEKVSQPITIKIDNTLLADLTIDGQTSAGSVSPMHIPITSNLDTNNGIKYKELGMNASDWIANSSGKMVIEDDTGEGAVRFNVEFSSPHGNWLYPRLELEAGIAIKNAVAVSFDMKVQNIEKPFNYMALIMNFPNGGSYNIQYEQPTEEWKSVNIVFRDDAPVGFVPDKAGSFSLGFNPNQKEVLYWIRNFKVYYGE